MQFTRRSPLTPTASFVSLDPGQWIIWIARNRPGRVTSVQPRPPFVPELVNIGTIDLNDPLVLWPRDSCRFPSNLRWFYGRRRELLGGGFRPELGSRLDQIGNEDGCCLTRFWRKLWDGV